MDATELKPRNDGGTDSTSSGSGSGTGEPRRASQDSGSAGNGGDSGSAGSGSRGSGGSGRSRSGGGKSRGGGSGSGGDRGSGGGTGSLFEFDVEAPFGLGELGAKPVAKGGDKRPEYRVLAQAVIVTAFNGVEVATGHKHWHKECEDVEPIVGPLCRMIEQLPKSTLKAFEKRFNGLMLLGGTCALVVPDVIKEVRIRNAERTIAKAFPEAAAHGGVYIVNAEGEVIGRAGANHTLNDRGQERSTNVDYGDRPDTSAPADLTTSYGYGGH